MQINAMLHPIPEPTLLFLYSCVMGAALGVIYDMFRIFRLAVKTHKIVIVFQDILYLGIWAMAVLWFSVYVGNGEVRLFYLVGTVLGWIVYYFTIGQLVFAVAGGVILVVKKAFGWLDRVFMKPILHAAAVIGCKLRKLFVKIKFFFKKTGKMLGMGLKDKTKVVYNDLVRKTGRNERRADANGKRSAKQVRKKARKKRSPQK